MSKIIKKPRSIVPACDVVDLDIYEKIVEATADNEKVGAYKIGFALGLTHELPKVIEITKEYTDKPIIFDLQKAGNDIPDFGKLFAKTCKNAEIDAVILFPFSSPITQYEWTKACQDNGLEVIIGGRMTHPRQIEGDYSNTKDKDYSKIFKELGFEDDLMGYIREDAPEDIYKLGARMGVTNFVIPGNEPKVAESLIKLLKKECRDIAIYSPGLITQGGNLSESCELVDKLGIEFHGIIGRGLYWDKKENRYHTVDEMKKIGLEYTSKI